MKKTFVLRTEAVLSSENATLRFGDDNTIVIPMAILENLYKYKGFPEKQRLASKFIEYIASISMQELLSERGFKQKNGSYLRVVDNRLELDAKIKGLQNISNLDGRVYQVCFDLKKSEKQDNVILISKNPTIRLKAEKIGIEAQPFKDELFPAPLDQYKGYLDVYASQATVSKLFSDGEFSIDEIYHAEQVNWMENMFLIIHTETSSALGRYTNGKIVPLKYSKKLPNGYKALNLEQTMLWECLLTPPEEAPLVVVKGAAGTGKTFCSLAMALERLKRYSDKGNELYDQILVASPTVTVSNECIGYLPGDIDEKVGPYLGGIMDNLKAIFRQKNPYFNNAELKSTAQMLFDQEYIEIQPIGFLRGRTIPYMCFIIDETQNIRPSDIKDIVTRSAKGSKFIFLGDPDQVNNPELNSRYNGLVYLSEKMKGNSLCWQVTLSSEKSVRGDLARAALEIL